MVNNIEDNDAVINYESRFLYRLIKVISILIFLLGLFVIIGEGWFARPIEVTDYEKSYIKCTNGKQYPWESISVHEESSLKILCAYGINTNTENSYALKMPSVQNYEIQWGSKIVGSWFEAFKWWILGILILYISVNMIREFLNYLFIGKPFDWIWLGYLLLGIDAFFEGIIHPPEQEKVRIDWKYTARILGIVFAISLVFAIVMYYVFER